MRVTIWGCRGSLPSPGPDTVRYGGNTSCVQVQSDDDTLIVLDAGTGLRMLGLRYADQPPKVVHVFLTHLHMDHLEGLPFFGPLWDSGVEFHLWGPPSPTQTLRERVERYLSPPLFPVHLSNVPSQPEFHDAPTEPVEVAGLRVSSAPISHAGPTVGYRIEGGDRSLAYLPDHEPARAIDINVTAPEWVSGYTIARDVDLLLHDSQYFEHEYPTKIGWGHSSIAHVTDFARIANVGTLMLFHHDPMHTDDHVDAKLERARELWDGDWGAIQAAREGASIELS